MQPHVRSKISRKSILPFVALLLIAANLRAPITGVAPVLDDLQAYFKLSTGQAGFLTTLPLLVFGAVAPVVALLARRIGIELALLIALGFITLGIGTRSSGDFVAMYVGTALIGAGIAVGNVLLPSVAKRDFPAAVPFVVGGCAISMGAAAALSSGTVVPIQGLLGWKWALLSNIIFPVAAILFWLKLAGRKASPKRDHISLPVNGIWKSKIAWQVTGFMGINSLVYYTMIAWLPSMLVASGITPASAGALHGVMQFSSAVPGLVLGPLVARAKEQSGHAVVLGMLMTLALFGFCWWPGLAYLWAMLFGLGSGGCAVLALMFMSLRTDNPNQAAALSGMAQCVGYLLAACGPALASYIYDVDDDWTPVLYGSAALTLLVVGIGVYAGRARTVGAALRETTN